VASGDGCVAAGDVDSGAVESGDVGDALASDDADAGNGLDGELSDADEHAANASETVTSRVVARMYDMVATLPMPDRGRHPSIGW
jgi:hypothetical protein